MHQPNAQQHINETKLSNSLLLMTSRVYSNETSEVNLRYVVALVADLILPIWDIHIVGSCANTVLLYHMDIVSLCYIDTTLHMPNVWIVFKNSAKALQIN